MPAMASAQSRQGGTLEAASESGKRDPRAGVPGKARRDADKLIQTLKTASQARVRAQAALALRGFPGDPAVADALIDALTDSEIMVRTSAARALSDVAPASGFIRICEIGLAETEPFALIWIRKAAARAAGGASDILLMVDALECSDGPNPGEAAQHLQSGFLKYLLEVGGYSIGSSIDFTDSTVDDDAPAVELRFRGAVRVQGTGSSAAAILEIGAIASNGFVVWQSTVEVDSVGRGPSEHVADKFDDEYTIRDDGMDARFMAAIEAGRKAAIIFDDDIRGSVDLEEESGGE